MFSLDIIWDSVMSKIDSYLLNNKQLGFYKPYFNDTRLVEFDESKAIVTTPVNLNKMILHDNPIYQIVVDCFREVTNKSVNIDFEFSDDYQRRFIESTIEAQLNDNINDDFSFDNFVVGPCNIEAKTAAFKVAKEPGYKDLNPLVIYGSSGLGKTHLLCAIGNYIKQTDTDKKILYISSSNLVKEVAISTREDRLSEYKNQLNSLDVLLVDDIQNLSNKPGTQNVFFDIYNELYNNHKQIVLTSDRPAHEIKDIEDRLRTRFSQGLSVTIQPLEDDTAYRILQMKIRNHKLDHVEQIDPEVLRYISQNYSSDVRSLEGALNRLLFYSINFSDRDVIDLNLAMEAFKGQPAKKTSESPIDFDDIIRNVANYYGLTDKQIKSKTRTKNIANARHIAMYLCRKHLDVSYLDIGKEFGGRDHSTVLSACEKIENSIKNEDSYRRAVAEIEATLK